MRKPVKPKRSLVSYTELNLDFDSITLQSLIEWADKNNLDYKDCTFDIYHNSYVCIERMVSPVYESVERYNKKLEKYNKRLEEYKRRKFEILLLR